MQVVPEVHLPSRQNRTHYQRHNSLPPVLLPVPPLDPLRDPLSVPPLLFPLAPVGCRDLVGAEESGKQEGTRVPLTP